MLEFHLKRETFKPCLEQCFTVHTEDAALELKLVEVQHIDGNPDREAFSLLFSCPEKKQLDQCIHTLEHAELGKLDIFLVPIQPDERGSLFEAVFN